MNRPAALWGSRRAVLFLGGALKFPSSPPRKRDPEACDVRLPWIPACAGMTKKKTPPSSPRHHSLTQKALPHDAEATAFRRGILRPPQCERGGEARGLFGRARVSFAA